MERVYIVTTKMRAMEKSTICYSEKEMLEHVSRETLCNIGDYEIEIKVKEL